MNVDALERHIRWAEGEVTKNGRHIVYRDSLDHETLGIGRLLSRGLSDDEVAHMLHNDVVDAIQDVSNFDYWSDLDSTRQLVVADMVFNLGLPTFKKFVNTNDALRLGQFDRAADEMEDSIWFRQTGRRAKKLVKAMRTGEWESE